VSFACAIALLLFIFKLMESLHLPLHAGDHAGIFLNVQGVGAHIRVGVLLQLLGGLAEAMKNAPRHPAGADLAHRPGAHGCSVYRRPFSSTKNGHRCPKPHDRLGTDSGKRTIGKQQKSHGQMQPWLNRSIA
jgi:hypothetical protein